LAADRACAFCAGAALCRGATRSRRGALGPRAHGQRTLSIETAARGAALGSVA
jgi:hypothetical protein